MTMRLRGDGKRTKQRRSTLEEKENFVLLFRQPCYYRRAADESPTPGYWEDGGGMGLSGFCILLMCDEMFGQFFNFF